MLSHPALFFGHNGGDAQREAFFAEERVAAVAAAEGPDLFGLREVGDVLVVCVAGPGHIAFAGGKRFADRVDGGHEVAVVAEHVKDGLADTGP